MTRQDMTGPRPQFVFGAADAGGVLLGLRVSQLVAIVAALAVFVAGLSAGPLPALVGLLVGAGLVGWAFVPWRGRTGAQWTPVLVRHATGQFTGRAQYRVDPVGASALSGTPTSWVLPVVLDGLEMLAVPVDGGRTVAVLVDRAQDRFTAVGIVSGRGFALLDGAAQDSRVSGWGALLAGLARDASPVCRLGWVERTVPDTGNAIHTHWNRAGRPDAVSAESYRQLIATAGPVTQAHTVHLTVSVDGRRAAHGSGSRGSGGRRNRDRQVCEVLLRNLAVLTERLTRAELTVTGWLPPRLLAAELHAAYQPGSRRRLGARTGTGTDSVPTGDDPVGTGQDGAQLPGIDPELAGPSATDTSWALYRHDDAVSVTYWVSGWPGLPVNADFLAPLLLHTDAARAFAVICEPVAPSVSRRRLRADATSERADADLRDRVGQVTTEEDLSAAEASRRRAAEIVAGHAEYRFAGYLTVTAADEQRLADSCAQVEQAADACLLEIHRLYGEQDITFTFTLPLGRGLR